MMMLLRVNVFAPFFQVFLFVAPVLSDQGSRGLLIAHSFLMLNPVGMLRYRGRCGVLSRVEKLLRCYRNQLLRKKYLALSS